MAALVIPECGDSAKLSGMRQNVLSAWPPPHIASNFGSRQACQGILNDMTGPTLMNQKPKVDEVSEEAAAEAGGGAAAHGSPLAAIGALIHGPKRKLVMLGGAGLLFLIAAIAAGIALVQEPAPKSVPAPVARDEQPVEPITKSGIEGRFDAMQRGDFSVRQKNRMTPDAATKDVAGIPASPAEPVLPAAEARRPDNEVAPITVTGKASNAGIDVPTAPARGESRLAEGCNVGGSDPKESAGAILACIREFNALDGREPRKKPPQVRPGN